MTSSPAQAEIDELSEDELSRRWREEGLRYVTSVNAFLKRGIEQGWENAGEAPEDNRAPMAPAVIAAVRRANESGNLTNLRERFPPAQEPFVDMLDENGQCLPVAHLLDDGRIVLRIGAPYEKGRVVIVSDNTVQPLDSDIITVGRSPNRKYFAIARRGGIAIHDGWEGPLVRELAWPTGLEDALPGFNLKPLADIPPITEIIPFPQGDRVLLVAPVGIFVIGSERTRRILPTLEELQEHLQSQKDERPLQELSYDYNMDMEHGAVSPDGSLIACGHQSSNHLVFDANTLSPVADVGPQSSYPHFAAFSGDGSMVAFNSCHFYNGITIGVPTSLLPGLTTEPFQDDPRLLKLEDGARVYAAGFRNDELIFGDAQGYLRAFDQRGNIRWYHFIGSSIGAIDVSPDGKRLIVTSYAGFLCILDLDTGQADPFAIGTATHQERRRWLFWKKEPQPLIW